MLYPKLHPAASKYIRSGTFHCRQLIICVLAFSFFTVTAIAAHAQTNILAIHTGLHPHKTRVVIDISELANYHVSTRGSPPEIIVDFSKIPSRNDIAALVKNAKVIGLVDHMTVEDKDGAVRLHIFLRKYATVDKSFTLKPEFGRQYRLVFDLKAVSAAQWARQVRQAAPPVPIAATKPSPAMMIKEAPVVQKNTPITQKTVPVTQETGTDPQPESSVLASRPSPSLEAENYNEVMTADSSFTLSGYVESEGRGFTQSSFSPEQKDWTMSFAIEPLAEYVSGSGDTQMTFRPFGRVDVNDKNRSHFDIRELKWMRTMDRWQLTVGINTVFWGVTESNHLVDVINQNDNLEDIDQEDKLGQPMVVASYNSSFGVFSAYIMTYFRERRYPGIKGRLRPPLPVDYSQTQYEAASDKWHTDVALRWTYVIDNVDVGLYHFRGTNREPELLLGFDGNNNPVLIPRYNLINQTGLDLQGTFEDFLVKLEVLHQSGNHSGVGYDYWAMTGGFEYTLYGLGGGDSDLGLLAEYLYDERGDKATTPFANDLFVGMRWAFNDIDGTVFLLGAISDLKTSTKFVSFEGSRRLGDNWKISLDARFFLGVPMTDILYSQSRDDFFQIRLARYF